uniref:Uncharacterized protein n=1 Tax=Arundo donax TaxID=35708 RepID=A0A0A9FKT5_ARUDO
MVPKSEKRAKVNPKQRLQESFTRSLEDVCLEWVSYLISSK